MPEGSSPRATLQPFPGTKLFAMRTRPLRTKAMEFVQARVVLLARARDQEGTQWLELYVDSSRWGSRRRSRSRWVVGAHPATPAKRRRKQVPKGPTAAVTSQPPRRPRRAMTARGRPTAAAAAIRRSPRPTAERSARSRAGWVQAAPRPPRCAAGWPRMQTPGRPRRASPPAVVATESPSPARDPQLQRRRQVLPHRRQRLFFDHLRAELHRRPDLRQAERLPSLGHVPSHSGARWDWPWREKTPVDAGGD